MASMSHLCRRSWWISAVFAAAVLSVHGAAAQEMPTLPMGINLGWSTSWTMECPWIDVMKSSNTWITYDETSGWSSGVTDSLEVDGNGYPLELPQVINGKQTSVRLRLNNHYEGRYVFLFDGEADIDWKSVPHEYVDGKHYVTFDGTGGTKYMNIMSTPRGNHLRHVRILPVDMETTYDPNHPFRQEYLDFLRPFQTLRFMPILGTNDGFEYIHWEDRPTPTYCTQNSFGKGIAIEHCIQLCNDLDADMWFNVPHPVWDDWIINAARMIRDSLKPCLKVYLEYSNEVWNWAGGYPQGRWIVRNGRDPDHPEWDCADSIHAALAAIGESGAMHPEKDAYMHARVFNIWRPIFEGAGQRDRLICIGAVQGRYTATVKRVLRYLFEVDGGGCDAVGPSNYFTINTAQSAFDDMPEGSVTQQMIYDSLLAQADRDFAVGGAWWQMDTISEHYGIPIALYEGGTAGRPDHHWGDSMTALFSSPRIYDVYRGNLQYWVDSTDLLTDCFLSTIGGDYSEYAHITDYSQVYLSGEQMLRQAPKYKALVDASAPKRQCTVQAAHPTQPRTGALRGACDMRGTLVSVRVPSAGMLTVSLTTPQGRRVALVHRQHLSADATSRVRLPVESLAPGVYLVQVVHPSVNAAMRWAVGR